MTRLLAALIVCTLAVAAPLTSAMAQVSGQAFEGFRGNSNDPIAIEADELEVIDGESRAIFKGNVKVRQGSSLITTGTLTVTYAKGGEGGQNDIERLDLDGGLVATSKENTAVADKGVYRVKTDDITLEGNVVISQGSSVAKGCRLDANLKNNVAKLKSCGGRVRSVFTPGDAPAGN